MLNFLRTLTRLILTLALVTFQGKCHASLLTMASQNASLQGNNDSDKLLVQFDIVSIKRNKSGSLSGSMSMTPDGDGITARNVPLRRLVEFAYNYRLDNLLRGAPDWAASERYDLRGKVAEADLSAYHRLTIAQQRRMVQIILEQRCELLAHIEIIQLPAFALVTAKGGAKMTRVAEDQNQKPVLGPNGEVVHEDPLFTTRGKLRSEGIDMNALALALSSAQLDRPVVNETGLTGKYSFVLQWSPDDQSSEASMEDARLNPALPTALVEQLGLSLRATKAPVSVLVIERLSRPSEN